ncbi:T9SS type A sorting domain-containing protein [Rhodocytophaga rosea]|uniref:T9SS type A sorting domain-containing protein n=1 Tax=Rhodocytophaga rosea TaxID=2704465 RepID=A0A6C0GEH8_9BACT|nr:T9SS type A sorting domain-containing protein [Rhodocytophaga rosea]QHT66376.1 T9SS type A sorting domain-containing protein [Rhodocytophaga rosea]
MIQIYIKVIDYLFNKNCLQKCVLSIILLFGISASSAYAQKTWIGTGLAALGGNRWDRAGNWNPNGIPAATDVVRFNSGLPTTITVVNVPNGGTIAGLLIAANNNIELRDGSFTITGDATINGTLEFDNNATRTITINGNLTGSGTIDMSPGNRAQVLNLAGTNNSLGTLTSSNSSTVNYTRAGNQQVFASTGYRNLTISGTGEKTLQGNITVASALNIANTNPTLTLNTYAATVNGSTTVDGTLNTQTGYIGGTGTFTLNSTGTLQVGSPNGLVTGTGSGNMRVSGTRNYGTGTIEYNGTAAQVTGNGLPASPTAIGNLIISNTAATPTVTLTNSLTVSGTTTINSGSLQFAAGTTQTVDLNGDLVGAGGAINMSGGNRAHVLNLAGANNSLGTLTASTAGTVNYDRNGSQQVFASDNYRNLTISGNNTKTLQGDVMVAGNLLVSSTLAYATGAAQTLDVDGNLSGSGTINMSGGNRAHVLNLSGPTNAIGTLTSSNSSTINYDGNIDQQVFASTGYRNLTISGTGEKTLQGNITVASALNIANTNPTLTLNTYAATVNGSTTVDGTLNTQTGYIGGTGTFTLNSTGTLQVGSPNGLVTGTGSGNMRVSGTRNYGTGTIEYNGTAAQVTGNGLPASPTAIGNLIISNTAATPTVTLTNSLTVSGTTTINSGSLQFAAGTTQTVDLNGDLVGAGGAINMSGGNRAHVLNLAGANNSLGTLTASTAGTVNYDRNGNQQVLAGANINYRNLIISGSNTKTLQGDVVVAGNLTVSSTLAYATGAAQALDVNGNLSGTGTLDMTGGNQVHTLNLSGTSNAITTLLATCYSIINYTAGAGVLSNPVGNNYTVSGTEALTGNIMVCDLLIPVGTTLNLNGFTVTIIKSAVVNGTLNAGTGAIAGTGSFTTNTGATIILGSADGINNTNPALGNIRTTGIRTFSANTNIEFNRAGSQVTGNGFPATIGSLTISNASQVNLSSNITVSSTATINGSLRYSASTPQTVSISGDLSGTGAIDMSNQPHALNLAGANNGIGMLTTSANASTVNYNGTGNQQIFASTSYRNLIISGSGIKTFDGTSSTINTNLTVSSTLQFSNTVPQTLNVNGDVSGPGTIDMSVGNLAHILNLAGPNNSIGILIPSCNSVVNYTGSGQQTFSNVAPVYTNYTISGTVTLTSNIIVCNNLIIPVGAVLNLNGYTATVNGSTSISGTLNAGSTGAVLGTGSFTVSGTIITASPDGINSGTSVGSIRVSGTRALTSGSFTYNGTLPQVTGNGLPITVGNFTLNNTAATPTVSLSQSLTISGLATFTTGTLSIGANTLSLNGTTSLGAGTATIAGGLTSNLSIGGASGVSTDVPLVTGGLLTLTINKAGVNNGAILRPAGNVTIYNGGSLSLQSGYFTNSNTITMGENVNAITNIIRKADASGIFAAPAINGKINVTYTASTSYSFQPSTGPELPTSATALNNLTIGTTPTGNSTLVTLSATAAPVVNGTFTINTTTTSSGLNLNGRTLTISGDYVNNSLGTFTGSTTSSIIINGDNKTVSGNLRFNPASAATRSLDVFTLNRTGTGSDFTISTQAEITNFNITSGTLTASGSNILITTATIGTNGKFINNSTAYPVVLPASTTTRAFNNNTYVAVNKFDRMAGTVTASNNTDITFTRGTGTPYVLRSRDLNPAPTAAIIRFELSASAASSQTDNAALMLGNGFADDGSRINAAASLQFNLRSGTGIRLVDGTFTSATQSSGIKVWWVVNKNAGNALSYTGPDGTTYTIDNGRSDLWAGTTRISSNMAISNSAIDLSEVKMVFDNGTGSITVKNLQINPVTQLVANMACWYAGYPIDIVVTANTAGGGNAFNSNTTFKVQRSDINGNFSNLTSNIVGTLTVSSSNTTNTFSIPATFSDLYSTAGTKDLGNLYRYRVISSDQNDPFVISAANNKPMYYIVNPGPETLDAGNSTLATVTATATGYTTSYWGYRLTSGAATIIPIPGTNSSSYTPKLTDFPGTGEYYLVAVSTSGCISNQKKIFVNCSGTNLIVNGNFNSVGANNLNDINGNGIIEYELGDFFTEYAQKQPSNHTQLAQGAYTISTNPNWYNGAFCTMTTAAQHAPTAGGVDGGNMLITDASPSGSKILWQQTVKNLKKHTNYVFTFWGTSIDQAHANTLQFGVYVNCYRMGDDVADNYASSCTWVKYSVQFNTGNETELTLGIGNVSVAGSGNDVGIDNIEFYECDDQNVAFQPLNKFVWIGYTSDWFKSDNWGLCAPNLPTCADNVIIPATLGAGRVYPVINGNFPDRTPDTWDTYKETNINGADPVNGISLINQAAQVQNITIEPGAQLTINAGYNLRICGNMTNDGTLAGTGTITFYGNTKQNISGTGTFSNVAIDQGNSATTAIVQQTSDITLSNLLDIQKATDELAINGKTLYFNGTLSTNPGTITGITSDPTTTTSALVFGGTGNVNGTLKFTTGYRSIARLTMNRSSSGQVTLGTPLTLVGGTNALTLVDGLINTSQTNYLQMDEFSTVTGSSVANQVSGGLNVSYVNGPMIKVTKSTDVFTFPVGNNGYLGQIGIKPNDSNLNFFRAEYIRAQGFPGATLSPKLDLVSPFEYWRMDRINGSSSGKISLHWTAATNISLLPNDWSDLRVARYSLKADTTQEGTTIANGIWQSRGNSYISPTATTTSGYIMSDMISQFSPYTFGTYTYIPLPVELLDIKAVSNNREVEIQWITANEHNSDHFILERSGDGVNFTPIAKVAAAGESKSILRYSYVDQNCLAGINYYRLQQVDKDNRKVSSKIVYANNNSKAIHTFNVYPNPSDGKEFYIRLAYKGEIVVSIYNILGIEVYRSKIYADGTDLAIRSQTPLSSGMYVVVVESANKKYQQKITIK